MWYVLFTTAGLIIINKLLFYIVGQIFKFLAFDYSCLIPSESNSLIHQLTFWNFSVSFAFAVLYTSYEPLSKHSYFSVEELHNDINSDGSFCCYQEYSLEQIYFLSLSLIILLDLFQVETMTKVVFYQWSRW
jgi:hypothetical protein